MKTLTKIFTIISLFFLFNNIIHSQYNPSNGILCYIKKGIERVELGKKNVEITSEQIRRLLHHFKIDSKLVESAFPKFKETDTLMTLENGRTIKIANRAKIFQISIPTTVSRIEVIDSLLKYPTVLYAEKDGFASVDVEPSDNRFDEQWGLNNDGQTGGTIDADIDAPEAWDIFKGSSSIKVGIIDLGVDRNHPDLSGKVSGSTTLYGSHGTHVSGIAAAKANNQVGGQYFGIAGVDWNARIIAKAFNNSYSSGDAYISQIINEAVSEGANVLNNSWKLLPIGRYSTTVRLAFADAYKLNRVAVASSGNTGNTSNTYQYPAGFGQGIIAVGATDHKDKVANFSTHHNYVDVAAPGVGILSCINGGGFDSWSGTSMAAPHVSGIASLIKGYRSYLDNDDIENIIRISADDKGTTGWDQYYGTGRVNARKALDYLRAPYSVNHWQKTGGTIVSSTWNNYQTFYGLDGYQDGTYIVERHTVEKTIYFPKRFKEKPYVWGRGVATNGYSADNPNFTMGYCEVVPGSITTRKVKLRTYIYDLYIEDPYDGWLDYQGTVPCQAQDVVFAYTALGKLSSGIEKKLGEEIPNKEITSNKLFKNYPNPFNPTTEINYQIKESGFVSLKVYDILGKEVATLVNEHKNPGHYSVTFDASSASGGLPSGVYIYKLQAGKFSSVKKCC